MTRERALHFQYDNGYVNVFKYDPEQADYILAVVLDPDGDDVEWGQHHNGMVVQLTDKQFQTARKWQLAEQATQRKRTGGLHE